MLQQLGRILGRWQSKLRACRNQSELSRLVCRSAMLPLAFVLVAQSAIAQTPLFDSHVHLWHGEESLRVYELQLEQKGLKVRGLGAMWFGGPNQALAGRPAQIQAGNDGIIALAAAHHTILPIATAHPYDGSAAVGELERVASKGIKVLKLHPHTQKFDPE